MQRNLEEKQLILRKERVLREEITLRFQQTEKENLQLRDYLNSILTTKLSMAPQINLSTYL
jgi:hypothetical protein